MLTVRSLYVALLVIVLITVITQYDRMLCDPLPSLPGTRWYNISTDDGTGYSNGLGFGFIDYDNVEMVDGDGTTSVLPYTIQGKRIIIKHPGGTVKLVRKGKDLVEWVGLGPLAHPVHFRPVRELKKPKVDPYI